MDYTIAVLPGDGIGPEVVDEAVQLGFKLIMDRPAHRGVGLALVAPVERLYAHQIGEDLLRSRPSHSLARKMSWI